jgi:cell division protein ZapE
LNLREAYEKRLRLGTHDRDPAQDAIVAELEHLQQQLQTRTTRKRGIFGLFRARARTAGKHVRGLYIWGGVGRGKTLLMDLFYETLKVEKKQRIHFHRMMQGVNARLTELGDVEDPLDLVAADLAATTDVLCFDEFYVSDIGDAMILGRLLDGLFRRGVTLVATSNSAPDDLYPEGLQRQRFLPAIAALKTHTRVIHIADGVDYRLRMLQQAGTYLVPDNSAARAKLQHYFDDSASSEIRANAALRINGRDICAHACAKGIAWFEFADICDGPRSQNDYIEIARWYPTVIVSGVPVLDGEREDQARRFIALVDEFYDRRVKLIVSAAAEIDSLYRGTRLDFEIKRTISRLIEMQSTEYLAAPHLA